MSKENPDESKTGSEQVDLGTGELNDAELDSVAGGIVPLGGTDGKVITDDNQRTRTPGGTGSTDGTANPAPTAGWDIGNNTVV